MSSDAKNGGNLDTGSGGFPVGDGGVRYTYDVGVPDDNDRTKWSAGKINVDQTNKDLSKSTKKTLASYLSDTTLGKTPSAASQKPNVFPVDAAEVNEIKLTDESGNVTPPHETSNQSKFVGWGSVSSRSAVATQQVLNIQRGRQAVPGQSSPIDGNRLLRDATVEGAMRAAAGSTIGSSVIDGKIPPVASTVLDSNSPLSSYSRSLINNRFNPDNTYESLSADKLSGGQFSKSYDLGQSPGPNDERDVSFGRLAQIGSTLSIRSGLELFSADPGNNPNSGGTEAGAILPGWTQLGVKRIESHLLNAEDVIRDLTLEGIDEDNLIDPMSFSWGTLNNALDHYAGISNFGMQLLAVALLVALALVVAAISSILGLFPSPQTTPSLTDKLGRYAYGAFEADSSGGNYDSIGGIVKAIITGRFNFWKVLGITSTKNPQTKCLPVGALAFFGVKAPNATVGGMASAAGEAALSVAQSPGYYSIMARGVNRSFLLIQDAFSSIGKAFGSGLVAGVKQLLSIIDTIKNSKFIKAVNIFSQLGDRIIRDASVEEHLSEDKESIGAGIRHLGILDTNPNLDAVQRSRINTKGAKDSISPLTLAWSAHRSPDLLLLPEGVANIISPDSAKNLGVPSLNHTIPFDPAGIRVATRVQQEPRIDTETREQIEDALESEYMPFYFHDIRTNEIVSFHAFLASLSDDYTASYDSVDAFGRVEPIKTYKGTQRKIGFSFYIVSTNPDDFNTMWLKLNKLTTLVYPQFSEGRSLIDDANGYAMHAPFSQTIQASPLIRVRLGDLIKSNYSKFNLARLFGYSYPGSKFAGKNPPAAGELSQSWQERAAKKEKVVNSYKEKPGSTFITDRPLGVPSSDKISSPIPIPLPTSSDPPPRSSHALYRGLVLKVIKKTNDDIVCEVVEASSDDIIGELRPEDKQVIEDCKGRLGSDWNIVGKKYIFKSLDLKPAPSTQKKIDKDLEYAESGDYTKAVTNFMDDINGNAVVKSFRSSGGKGLAGFIESLSYDWYEKTTWEIGRGVESPGPELGRRAPKMCKVTISFTPIHDIAPGLDHMGGNRAPVYPVGPLYGLDYKGIKNK